MILIDFSNLVHRLLFVSTMKTSSHILEYRPLFLHMLFNNIRKSKITHGKKYGEIILAIDAKKSWRKDLYPEYKANRKASRDKNPIEFIEFYKLIEETLEVIEKAFPFKVVRANEAEGDDIIAILAKHYNSEKTLIISEDKDMMQLRKYPNIDVYRPIQDTFNTYTNEEIDNYMINHLLIGDSIDNIPTIKKDTEFTPAFKKYLEQNQIFTKSVRDFQKLSISSKLLEEFTPLNKKGQKDIYKAPLFGEVKAKEFAKNLKENLFENRLYIKNYVRNRKLIDFKYIPKEIEIEILKSYNSATFNYAPMDILNYFNTNRLKVLTDNVQDFYMDANGKVSTLMEQNQWFS